MRPTTPRRLVPGLARWCTSTTSILRTQVPSDTAGMLLALRAQPKTCPWARRGVRRCHSRILNNPRLTVGHLLTMIAGRLAALHRRPTQYLMSLRGYSLFYGRAHMVVMTCANRILVGAPSCCAGVAGG
jgi:hypothetical protein